MPVANRNGPEEEGARGLAHLVVGSNVRVVLPRHAVHVLQDWVSFLSHGRSTSVEGWGMAVVLVVAGELRLRACACARVPCRAFGGQLTCLLLTRMAISFGARASWGLMTATKVSLCLHSKGAPRTLQHLGIGTGRACAGLAVGSARCLPPARVLFT